jgi:hypothetical protein
VTRCPVIKAKAIIASCFVVVVVSGLLLLLFGNIEEDHSDSNTREKSGVKVDSSNGDGPISFSPASSSQPVQPGDVQPSSTSTGFGSMKDYDERIENDREFAIAVLKKQAEDNPQVMRRLRAIERAMIPFEFHGRVVDAQGNPISEAVVHYKAGYPFGVGYTPEMTVETGSDGRFVVRDRADSLLIKDIRKQDFHIQESQVHSVKFRYRADEKAKSWLDYGRGNPYVFVMVPFH